MAQRSGPPRLNPNCTFNINLKTDLKRQVGCHSTARLAGQIRFCLIHASRVKTDRPTDHDDHPNEHCFAYQRYSWNLEVDRSGDGRARTDGRKTGRLSETLFIPSPSCYSGAGPAARARRSPSFPPVELLRRIAFAAPTKKNRRIDFHRPFLPCTRNAVNTHIRQVRYGLYLRTFV